VAACGLAGVMGRSFYSYSIQHQPVISTDHVFRLLIQRQSFRISTGPLGEAVSLSFIQLNFTFSTPHQPKVLSIACTLHRIAGTTSAKPFLSIY